MKFYVLDGRIKGQPIKEKVFASRGAAERAMEAILYNKDLQVEEDLIPTKHTEVFVCDNCTEFSIRRVILGA